jgi:hypothetical protein
MTSTTTSPDGSGGGCEVRGNGATELVSMRWGPHSMVVEKVSEAITGKLQRGASFLSACQLGQTGRSLQFQRKAAGFVPWHGPDDARVSRADL